MSPICQIELHWLAPEDGGRTTPFRGERYTPTARFAGEVDQFSVILEFALGNMPNPTKAALRQLNPDLREVQRRTCPGTTLEIMEGSKFVAKCRVGKLIGAEDLSVVNNLH